MTVSYLFCHLEEIRTTSVHVGGRKNVMLKSYLLIIKTVSAHFLNQPELQPACTLDLHIRLLCLLLIYCHHPFSQSSERVNKSVIERAT